MGCSDGCDADGLTPDDVETVRAKRAEVGDNAVARPTPKPVEEVVDEIKRRTEKRDSVPRPYPGAPYERRRRPEDYPYRPYWLDAPGVTGEMLEAVHGQG